MQLRMSKNSNKEPSFLHLRVEKGVVVEALLSDVADELLRAHCLCLVWFAWNDDRSKSEGASAYVWCLQRCVAPFSWMVRFGGWLGVNVQ